MVGKLVVSIPGLPDEEFPLKTANAVERLGFFPRIAMAANYMLGGRPEAPKPEPVPVKPADAEKAPAKPIPPSSAARRMPAPGAATPDAAANPPADATTPTTAPAEPADTAPEPAPHKKKHH